MFDFMLPNSPAHANLLPTKTAVSQPTIVQQNHVYNKRQQATESVVHVTVTAAGTVVYTYTATSYSYVPSYSTISETGRPTTNAGQNNGNTSSNDSTNGNSGTNVGAIVGGVVGGLALIALIALGFFFLRRRSQKRKREKQKNELIDDDDDSYYRGHGRQPSTATALETGAVAGMTSLDSPAPRHLVAPLQHLGDNGRESKYFQNEGGYYEDVVAPYPTTAAYYSGNNSVASDSLPSTAVDNSTYGGGVRHVPNEADYLVSPNNTARHVPHLKDNHAQEPPHSKD
ncbi:uncharacterized protein B0P05DRAFT_529631 [Gilbertella persicaria]|uniref:uncharacterized protein n=1 Tax=Gilbertella persicaria TaxID=101096 RepID=UPI00221FA80F|nr:uncharacterized protein B0P05DRAFT_529631 [Gilbertella persicaria]KAI8090170.1 hypothetical protein B0P05DRAFT_529631 [Gilbertella persicaria]